MIIRKNQMDTLGQERVENFIDRMVEHSHKFFPGEAATLGEEGLRQMIQESMQRADQYHILRERDVAKFIQLDFALDPSFEEKPQMSWAKAILEDHSLPGGKKIEKLYEELPGRLQKIENESAGQGQ